MSACPGLGLSVVAGGLSACHDAVTRCRRRWYTAPPVRGCASPRASGDPRGVLNLPAGRRHNQRTRDWRIGHLIAVLKDKAEAAGISLTLVDERGTSSTCPACGSRIPKPAGRVLACPACQYTGHRDLVAAANIAARLGGGTTPAIPAVVTHRRAGATCPVLPPRDVTHAAAPITAAPAGPLAGTGPPTPAPPRLARESLAIPARSLNTARNYRHVHRKRGRRRAPGRPRRSLSGRPGR